MSVTTLSGLGSATLVIPATAVATSAPTSGTDGIALGGWGTIRTLLDYTGTVNSCTVKVWLRDVGSGEWYEGPTTDDLDPLTPGGASPVDEARDWDVGQYAQAYFQIAAISGGGTVAVRVQGVRS